MTLRSKGVSQMSTADCESENVHLAASSRDQHVDASHSVAQAGLTRRTVLRFLATSAGMALLAACTSAPAPAAPTNAPVARPTEPPKPAAATTAPVI